MLCSKKTLLSDAKTSTVFHLRYTSFLTCSSTLGNRHATPSSLAFLILKMDSIKTSAANATSLLNPSPKDLLLAIPRAIARLGSFAFISVPERIDDLMGLRNGGSVIAEATGEMGNKTVLTALSGVSSVQGTAVTTSNRATVTGVAQGGVLSHAFSFQQVRNFGGVFTYMTSRWAMGCFILVSSNFPLGWRFPKCCKLHHGNGVQNWKRPPDVQFACITSFRLLRWAWSRLSFQLVFDDAGWNSSESKLGILNQSLTPCRLSFSTESPSTLHSVDRFI